MWTACLLFVGHSMLFFLSTICLFPCLIITSLSRTAFPPSHSSLLLSYSFSLRPLFLTFCLQSGPTFLPGFGWIIFAPVLVCWRLVQTISYWVISPSCAPFRWWLECRFLSHVVLLNLPSHPTLGCWRLHLCGFLSLRVHQFLPYNTRSTPPILLSHSHTELFSFLSHQSLFAIKEGAPWSCLVFFIGHTLSSPIVNIRHHVFADANVSVTLV